MKTISFYSYKGGVGRSLALAYTAKYLARRNIGVCVLDIDLEAPGVAYKFSEKSELVLSKLGVVDYVHSCITSDKAPDSIEEYFSTVYEKESNKYGYVKIMSAGKDINTNEYWKKLSDINWSELFLDKNCEGLYIFENLKCQIEEQINPDYLLIDSRSGVTTMGKVCNSVLPDKVVMFLANNTENFFGTKLMYNHISNSADYKVNKVKSDIICAITRFPTNDDVDISKKLTMLDMTTKESDNIIKDFLKIFDNPSPKKEDIIVIYSERDVERDELSILQKNRIVETKIIEENYIELINKLVDKELLTKRKNINIYIPQYSFIKFDLHETLEKEIKKIQEDLSYEEFRGSLKKLMAETPSSYHLLYKYALCERYENNIIDAIMHLSSVIDNAQEDDEWKIHAHYWRGVMFLYDFNNYKESLKDLEFVYNTSKSFNINVCYDLALCNYCLYGLYECPKTAQDNLCKSTCPNVKAKNKAMEYVERYVSDNKYDYRAFLLRAIINRDKFKNNKGQGNIQRSEKEKIISDFNKAMKLNKDFACLYNHRGLFYFYINEIETALYNYDKAIELDPGPVYKIANIAYKNKGDLYFNLGEIENALENYHKAIEIYPNYAAARKSRGDIYSDLGKIKEALEDYEKAYVSDPKSALFYNNLGRLRKPPAYYKALELNFQYDHCYYDTENIIDRFKFPIRYHETDEHFEFVLIKKDSSIILTDQARTLKMLDKVCNFSERNETKNLATILKEFHVFKNGFDFSIEIRSLTIKDEENKALEEAKCRLFRCVSFMDKMRLFYEDDVPFSVAYNFNLFVDSKTIRDSQYIVKRYSFLTKYYNTDTEYEFALMKKDDKYYLTDQGKTYEMLDKVFELKGSDVQKHLNAIMQKCKILQSEDELLIGINAWDENSETEENSDINEAKYRLLECVSFMDTMRIFYV
jgi:tetratricopeptide (TPR) repeat protein/MinD-like ATPase involved in chromosome partitioning or flagellar assembly